MFFSCSATLMRSSAFTPGHQLTTPITGMSRLGWAVLIVWFYVKRSELIGCFHVSPPAVWVWYFLRTMNITYRLISAMSCYSCSVSVSFNTDDVLCKISDPAVSSSIISPALLSDLQSLLPNSFESAGHVFLAPRFVHIDPL